MTLTMTDLFCGAGGSSSGAERIPGVTVRMAANHWKLAVETHNTNLPHADHDCADISQTDPRRYPTTDLLWASPECTNHSQARGKRKQDKQADLFGDVLPDAAAERSRATMWDVCRFVEAMKLRGHPYKGFVVENVVEVEDWLYFEPWRQALTIAGYCLHLVYLNSMHAQHAGLPAPQSRDRWYCVGHLTKYRCPDLEKWTRPLAWCPSCTEIVPAMQAWKKPSRQRGRYRQQYVWRCPKSSCRFAVVEPGWLPAAAAIDWSLRGTRIGDRSKPLAPKTMARIEAGLRKFARPITLEAAGNTFERRPGVRTWPVDAPLTTQTTTLTKALAVPPMLVPAGGTWNDAATSVTDVMRTRTARETEALLVPVEGRDGKQAARIVEPLRTQTARNETAIVVPLRQNNTAKHVTQPFDTFAAAGNHHALVMRNNSSKGDGGEMCTPVDEVLRTLTTKGHQSLVTWDHLIYDYNGRARTPGEALPTQTAKEGNALVSLEVGVADCEFRMLEPHEIKAGMAFASSYVLLGNRREQVRLAGNAVTPPAARDLIGALVEAITGEEAAA